MRCDTLCKLCVLWSAAFFGVRAVRCLTLCRVVLARPPCRFIPGTVGTVPSPATLPHASRTVCTTQSPARSARRTGLRVFRQHCRALGRGGMQRVFPGLLGYRLHAQLWLLWPRVVWVARWRVHVLCLSRTRVLVRNRLLRVHRRIPRACMSRAQRPGVAVLRGSGIYSRAARPDEPRSGCR